MTAAVAYYGPRPSCQKGYGRFGVNYEVHLAHRWIYQEVHGVTLDRLDFVLHSCDNPSCVNVNHLRVGTGADNTADMDARHRRNPLGAPGETNAKAKLTATQVLDMRQRHANGAETYASLAREFGVSETAIKFAITGRNWSHL